MKQVLCALALTCAFPSIGFGPVNQAPQSSTSKARDGGVIEDGDQFLPNSRDSVEG